MAVWRGWVDRTNLMWSVAFWVHENGTDIYIAGGFITPSCLSCTNQASPRKRSSLPSLPPPLLLAYIPTHTYLYNLLSKSNLTPTHNGWAYPFTHPYRDPIHSNVSTNLSQGYKVLSFGAKTSCILGIPVYPEETSSTLGQNLSTHRTSICANWTMLWNQQHSQSK